MNRTFIRHTINNIARKHFPIGSSHIYSTRKPKIRLMNFSHLARMYTPINFEFPHEEEEARKREREKKEVSRAGGLGLA